MPNIERDSGQTIHDRDNCTCTPDRWCGPCLAEAVRLADEAAGLGYVAVVESRPGREPNKIKTEAVKQRDGKGWFVVWFTPSAFGSSGANLTEERAHALATEIRERGYA